MPLPVMRLSSPGPYLACLVCMVVLVVAGCAGESTTSRPAAKEPGGTTAGAGPADGESGAPSGEPTVETSDGGEVVTSGEISDRYPAKKVPVLKGTVLSSASAPGKGFNVTVLVDGRPARVAKKAVRKLTKRGFKVTSERTVQTAVITVVTSADFQVELAATPSGGQTSLNYVVTSR
ncbi:MAG: hypothetical protein ACRCYU_21005 [Nocardioides sp.]